MKRITFEGYKHEKVLTGNIDFFVPEEPVFYHKWNHRVMVGIFPQFTTWEEDKTRVWELQIVKIDEDKQVLRSFLRISELSSICASYGGKRLGQEDILKDEIFNYFSHHATEDRVTREDFELKLSGVNNRISDLLNGRY